MDTLLHDLRFAFRTLGRRPGFAAAAVTCLGLGIGANTAAFSVVHGMLYRALPFDEPDRVVSVEAVSRERGVTEGNLTFADLADLRATGVFEAVAGVTRRSVTLTGEGRAERVQAAAVTPGLFELLGETPASGRVFRSDDAAPAGFEEVVVISHSLWQRRFGGASSVVGRTLRINGRPLVVVGITEPGFRFPENEELWLPLGSASATERSARSVWGVGRLTPGVDAGEATARLGDLSARLRADFPGSHRAWAFEVTPFRERFIHPMGRRLLELMLGAVGFVLLIACANVANLLLVRGVEREGELAVRTALGASRGQVVRQLLTEAGALGISGAALGWLLAVWFVEWLVEWVPEDMAYWIRIEMDTPVLLFTLGLGVVTALLFGTLPALRLSRPGALGPGYRTVSRRGGTGLRELLVASEVALSLVLLVGAGLLVRSFLRIDAADPGFPTSNVLTFRTVLAGDRYDPAPARAEFYQSAAEAIAALPGVRGAAVTSSIPADDGGPLVALALREETPPEERVNATVVVSTGGFFDAVGARLVAGRQITASEARDTAADVAVVGRSLARRLWPDGDGVGRRVHVGDAGWFRVVGVADDLQYEEFGEETDESRLQIHLPYGVAGWREMNFLVRAAGDPALVSSAVRATLTDLDPDLPPWDVLTMDERLRITTWPQRFFAFLFPAYGIMALTLALTGVYGVIAYEVGRRRREIGVRMALGASRGLVTREVVVRAARLVAAGTAVGVVGAVLLSRGMRGVLYGVAETDLSTFAGAAVLMATAGLLAGYLPARRAARLQPSEALRSE